MTDVVLGIRLKIDGKDVSGEIRGQTEDLRKLGTTAAQANTQARGSADQFTSSLRRQAETLGMTRTQTLAYEASQHKLTEAQRQQVSANIRAIEQHERHERMLGRVRIAAAAAGATLAAVYIASLKASVTAAIEAEQAQLRLEAVLRSTGYQAGLNGQELSRMAGEMQDRLGFDDETIMRSMAVMLTFRQVTREHFGEAMEVAANLSRVLGTDLQSAVLQLGKALEDPEQGLTALTRSGVSFTAAQKEQIRTLVETGRQADAITQILRTMKEQGLEGVAQEMNQGLFKATNSLKNAWGDLLESLGQTGAVKTTVEVPLAGVARALRELKEIVELPWWERVKYLYTGGLYTPPQMNAWAASVGGAESRNARDLDADVGARAAMRNAQDRAGEFLTEFRTDAQKRAEDLRKLETLYSSGGMSPEEFAAGQAAVNAKYSKKGVEGADFTDYLRQLRQQVELGREATAVDKILFDLRETHWKNATPALREQALELGRQQDARKNMEAANRAAVASAELLVSGWEREGAVVASLNTSLSEHLQDLELETQLIGASEAVREKALALRRLDNQFLKETAELQGEALETATKLYEVERSRIADALDRRGTARAAQKIIEDSREEAKKFEEDLRRGLTDSIFRGFEAGKGFGRNFFDALKNMAQTTILRPLVEFTMAPYSKAITELLGGLGIPGLPAAPGPTAAQSDVLSALAWVGFDHRGRGAGEPSSFQRPVPASLFSAAPRLHTGIGPGERPAIIRDDEAVLTPGQMRMLAPRADAAPNVAINLINRGAPMQATQSGPPRFEAGRWVIDVWIEALRTRSDVRDAARSYLGQPV